MDEACDSRLQRQRRALLIPDAPKYRPDPEPKEIHPLRTGLLASLVSEPEEQDDEEQSRTTDIVAANAVPGEDTGVGSETDPEETELSYDLGSDEDASESQYDDDEAEA
jgi:hypothetical protein